MTLRVNSSHVRPHSSGSGMIIFYHKYFKYLAWKMFGIKVEKVDFGVGLFIAHWETWIKNITRHNSCQVAGYHFLSAGSPQQLEIIALCHIDRQSYFWPCWMWLNLLIYMLTFEPTCSMLWVCSPLWRKCCVLTFGNISSKTVQKNLDLPLDHQGSIIFFCCCLLL